VRAALRSLASLSFARIHNEGTGGPDGTSERGFG
jgi:hypothetical protein